jgi:glycosyltransferase involved in cell wall biosynthesis
MKIGIVTQALIREHGQGRVNHEFAQALIAQGDTVIAYCTEICPQLRAHPQIIWRPIRVGVWPTQLLRDQIFAVRSAIALKRDRGLLDKLIVNGFITWGSADVNLVHFVHTAWLRSRAHPIRSEKKLASLYRWLYSRLNAWLENRAFRQCRRLVAVSDQVRRELLDCGVPESQIEVIYNGVDLDRFSPGVRERGALALPDGAFVAAFAGDLKTSRKNLDAVIEVVARLPAIHLAIAGDTEASPYPARVKERGLSKRVHFLGQRSDVEKTMRASDVFVFPSRYEPFGLVLLEASACGVPVVTARSAGACDVLSDGGGAIIIEDAEDIDALTEAVRRIVEDSALRGRMAEAARRTAERYPWSRATSQFCGLLNGLTKQPERAPC